MVFRENHTQYPALNSVTKYIDVNWGFLIKSRDFHTPRDYAYPLPANCHNY